MINHLKKGLKPYMLALAMSQIVGFGLFMGMYAAAGLLDVVVVMAVESSEKESSHEDD